MFFVREDKLAKLMGSGKHPTEGFYEEMNLRKWLISCSYNPSKSMTGQHVEALSKSINLHLSTYENFIF